MLYAPLYVRPALRYTRRNNNWGLEVGLKIKMGLNVLGFVNCKIHKSIS